MCRSGCTFKTIVRLEKEIVKVGRSDGAINQRSRLAALIERHRVPMGDRKEARIVTFNDDYCSETYGDILLLQRKHPFPCPTNLRKFFVNNSYVLTLVNSISVVEDILRQTPFMPRTSYLQTFIDQVFELIDHLDSSASLEEA